MYLLFHKLKLDFTIPSTTIDNEKLDIDKTRVLFDSISDMLLIYVPKCYLQFIDCAPDHYPSFSLSLYGKLKNYLFYIN